MSAASFVIFDNSANPVQAGVIKTVRAVITPAVLTTLSHTVSARILTLPTGKVPFVLSALAVLKFGGVGWTISSSAVNLALAPSGVDVASVSPLLWVGTYAPTQTTDLVASVLALQSGAACNMAALGSNLELYVQGGTFSSGAGNGNLELYITYTELSV